MHIGHFIRDLDGLGGIETYVDRLQTGLEGRGHRVTLFGLKGDDTLPSRVRISDVGSLYERAVQLDIDVLHLHKAVSLPPPPALPVLRTVHDNGAACPSGSRYLKRTGEPCPRTASLPACLFGHYVDGCGSRRPEKVRKNFQRLSANRRVLPGLPVVTVSRYLKNEMVAAGYRAENMHVILSPAPEQPTVPPPPPGGVPRLLFAGRLVPEKGVEWLLRALARLPLAAHLDVAGDGDHRPQLEAAVDRLGLRRSVTFHGWTERASLDALYRAARAVVVPSVWHEPAGLVPLEAAAHGRPVVASQVGGLPEYADSSFSLLVPPNDDDELAYALQQLCRDPDRAASLGAAGYEHVRTHHSLPSFLDWHETFYTSLLSPLTAQSAGRVKNGSVL